LKQVLQHARTGEISVAEVPAPQLLPGCVLVGIAASVVSAGTERASAEFARKSLLEKARSRPDLVRDVIRKVRRDGIFSALEAVRSRLDQPQSPGYSSAGTVLAVGEGVTDIQVGDRVSCAGAGYAVHAEVGCIPRLLLARIPGRESAAAEQVPFEHAAFATLGAVALHGIRTAEVKLGDLVGVVGAGLLGQLTLQLLKAAGCRVAALDIDPARAHLAQQMGADAAATSASAFREHCLEMSRGAGLDAVLITAETPSSDPVNLAGAVARDRAVIVAVGTVGMAIERKVFYDKELDFRISRSYGPGRYDAAYEQQGRDYPIGYVRWTETRNMEAFVRFLAEGKVHLGPLITHRYPIERAREAYDLITGRSGEAFLGVVIAYSGSPPSSQALHLLPNPAPPVPQPAVGTTSVGVLGAGSFASAILIPSIQASASTVLVRICAATGAHAEHAARKFAFRSATTAESEVLHDPEINTVVVATRHHLHARQVMAALAAGKNVFCEKPLCLREEELRQIVAASLATGSSPSPRWMVGFNRRFAPMTVAMKDFLASVSEPLALQYRINAGFLPPDHWVNSRDQGGGRILGEVCHFVDLLMFLAGAPIVEVGARALGDSGRYSGDNVLVALRFANGSQGSVSYVANGDRSFSKERIEVFGGGSTAVLDDFRQLELVRDGHRRVLRSRWKQDKGHRAEWAAFERSLVAGAPPAIALSEMVCSTLATFKIEESLASGSPLAVDAAAFFETARGITRLTSGQAE
jgi:predicted dehydrogenase/threonine dehydrogenase-like Zn-dependent dehydrogenase